MRKKILKRFKFNLYKDAAHGLAGLNSRFSHIIERNNQMTDENAKLQAENETLRETKKAEVDKVKQFYEVEIAEARRLLDAEAEKVVSLKFSYIDCIILNLTWFEI